MSFLPKRLHIVGPFIIIIIIGLAATFYSYKKSHPVNITLKIADEKIIIPAFPQAKLLNSTTDPIEGIKYLGTRFETEWETDAAVQDVINFYSKKLEENGFKADIKPNTDSENAALASFYNDKYTVYVSATRINNTDKTKVTVQYQTKHSDVFEPGEDEEDEERQLKEYEEEIRRMENKTPGETD